MENGLSFGALAPEATWLQGLKAQLVGLPEAAGLKPRPSQLARALPQSEALRFGWYPIPYNRRASLCASRKRVKSGGPGMQKLLGNLRYAVRQFRQSPVFTAAAVLTLALGIGGTTAIFTLIHAVMLRSLPVSDPGRLYRVGEGDDCCVEGGPQDRWGFYSFPLYERLKAETPEFEEVAAFQAGGGSRACGAKANWLPGRCARSTSPGIISPCWECAPSAGGCSAPEDDRPARSAGGRAQPSCLADQLWRRSFGGGFDLRRGGPSVYRDRSGSARILRRNAAQRPSRYLDPRAAGALD